VLAALIARLTAAGIVVSAGHSAASAAQTQKAMAAGLSGFTHLFNAMAPISARAPGIAAAALISAGAYCGVIIDGVHVAPEMIALMLAVKSPDRIMLVSDAMPCCGTGQVEFMLGDKKILRSNGVLTTEDGVLAGADLCLLRAVLNMVAIGGVDPAVALSMASAVPAAFLGILGERGVIAPGAIADLLWLDEDLTMQGRFDAGVFCEPAS
jgi:N-acetylglucosamine-6-phosphate deacetylase